MRRYLAAISLAFALTISDGHAHADELAKKYGVDSIAISPEEKAIDQKFGGFPNNPNFNNETKCRKVLDLFATKGIGPTSPRMVDFLTYSRVKLMEFDIGWHFMHNEPALIDSIEPEKWKLLPAMFPTYCRKYPNDTLEEATMGVYRVARMTFGP